MPPPRTLPHHICPEQTSASLVPVLAPPRSTLLSSYHDDQGRDDSSFSNATKNGLSTYFVN